MKVDFAWRLGAVLTTALLAATTAACSGQTAALDEDAGDDAAPDAAVTSDSATSSDVTTGDDASVSDDASTEAATVDATRPPSGDGAALLCGTAPCADGDQCCLTPTDAGGFTAQCLATCPTGGGVAQCAGPENCTAQASLCCGTLVTGPGMSPSCPVTMVTTTCAAACPTDLSLTCNATEQARLCHHSADCAGDPTSSTCCTFESDAGSALSICVSPLLAGITSCPVQP